MFITRKLQRIDYPRYLQFQRKLRLRRREGIVFLEHPPTITLGSSSHTENILVARDFLQNRGISIISVRRGGDVTAHEPGQVVIYPHIDLSKRKMKIARFMDIFLQTTSELIESHFALATITRPEAPGLYLKQAPEKKLVSIGVYFKSFFTGFGLAINVDNDLSTFQYINPCGIQSNRMTSILKEGKDPHRQYQFIEDFSRYFPQRLAN